MPDGQSDAPNQPPPLSGGGIHTRRRLLKIGGGLGLIGTAGFGYLSWDRGEPTTVTAVPEGIPGAAEFVVTGETGTLLSDQSFQDAIDEELSAQGIETADNLEAFLDSITVATGIDPREVETTTAFGATTGQARGFGGVIFEVDTDGIRELLAEAGVLVDESEYSGYDLYGVEIGGAGSTLRAGLDSELVVCELDDGEFAVGTRREIEGVIEIRKGNRPGISTALGNAIESATPGEIRFGFRLSGNLFELLGLPAVGSQVINLDSLEHGYGSLGDGELSITIRAASADAATDLGSQLTAISTALAVSGEADIIEFPPEIEAQLLEVVAGITVETDGQLVNVTVPGSDRLAAIVIVFVVGKL